MCLSPPPPLGPTNAPRQGILCRSHSRTSSHTVLHFTAKAPAKFQPLLSSSSPFPTKAVDSDNTWRTGPIRHPARQTQAAHLYSAETSVRCPLTLGTSLAVPIGSVRPATVPHKHGYFRDYMCVEATLSCCDTRCASKARSNVIGQYCSDHKRRPEPFGC